MSASLSQSGNSFTTYSPCRIVADTVGTDWLVDDDEMSKNMGSNSKGGFSGIAWLIMISADKEVANASNGENSGASVGTTDVVVLVWLHLVQGALLISIRAPAGILDAMYALPL